MSDNAATGEETTGFVKYRGRGPFKCGNCVHMEGGYCEHPVMMRDSKQPKNAEGYVKVDSGDCCRYQRRPGD